MKQRTSWDPAGVTAHRHAAHRHKKEENDPNRSNPFPHAFSLIFILSLFKAFMTARLEDLRDQAVQLGFVEKVPEDEQHVLLPEFFPSKVGGKPVRVKCRRKGIASGVDRFVLYRAGWEGAS